jgi:hypothetical protein
VLVLGISRDTYAQIFWQNPGFEGNPCMSVFMSNDDTAIVTTACPLAGFSGCKQFHFVPDDSILNRYFSNFKILQGKTSLGLCFNTYGNNHKLITEVSSTLTCNLKKDRIYRFSVFGMSTYAKAAKFQLNIMADSCSVIDALYESPYLDSVWKNCDVVFKATSASNILNFSAVQSDDSTVLVNCVLLDSLTPILPHNGNDVHSTMNDTVVKTPACFTLAAHANISTYDTVYWKDSSGTILASDFDGGTVCPQASTYYVIAMRDSVPDCAGYWWSYDTVRITINPALDVKDVQEKEELQVYPTRLQQGQVLTIISPASGIVEVYTIDGKKVGTCTIQEGGQTLNEFDSITSQMLLLRFRLSNGSTIFKKILLYR